MAGLIEIRNLSKRHYQRGLLSRAQGGVLAVDRVSFSIPQGSVFGLVGESGCGKTTLARALLLLDPPTSGEVLFGGTSLSSLSRRQLRTRRRKMQIVFQDPNSAMDPKMRVGASVEEGLRNLRVPAAERARRVRELLDLVGIPAEHAARYPHEFSGGQKQRIVIARALSMDPEFLVLDEPVSNLDVSIQAQIINLLLDLKERLGLTYLFISHDLHLVAFLSDTIGVMYKGRLVEMASTAEIMSRPVHPYTLRLFASVPGVEEMRLRRREEMRLRRREEMRLRRREEMRLRSREEMRLRSRAESAGREEPAPAAETEGASGASRAGSVPRGCPYAPSCPLGDAACAREEPRLVDIGGGHMVSCFKVTSSAVADRAQPFEGGRR